MPLEIPSRDELYVRYVDQLPYEPYPVQDLALAAWFESEQGVLVCAPTGTGKTLIAEAALFEALHTGSAAYYTTPLIALTEQKFQEMQDRAVEWGFRREDVGLVTGSRKVNPEAPVLIVVAEILLNRLLNQPIRSAAQLVRISAELSPLKVVLSFDRHISYHNGQPLFRNIDSCYLVTHQSSRSERRACSSFVNQGHVAIASQNDRRRPIICSIPHAPDQTVLQPRLLYGFAHLAAPDLLCATLDDFHQVSRA